MCSPAPLHRLPLSVLATLLLGIGAAQAGPCTDEIAAVEQQINATQAAAPPSGAGQPTAPQTVDAQLHHQPTPGAVQSAEHQANADGDAALERARQADAAGNAAACEQALSEARQLYGVN
jgi:hypothetical protein